MTERTNGRVGRYEGTYVYPAPDYLKDYAAYDISQVGRYLFPGSWGGGVVEPTPKFTADSYVKLELAVLTAGDVTVAQLTSPTPHHGVYRGSAKRHKDDKDNPSIGNSLAVARALREYADALERKALKESRK